MGIGFPTSMSTGTGNAREAKDVLKTSSLTSVGSSTSNSKDAPNRNGNRNVKEAKDVPNRSSTKNSSSTGGTGKVRETKNAHSISTGNNLPHHQNRNVGPPASAGVWLLLAPQRQRRVSISIRRSIGGAFISICETLCVADLP